MVEGINNIVKRVEEYKKAVEGNAERLVKWDDEVCSFVKDKLDEIAKQNEIKELGLYVDEITKSTRSREINFRFGTQPYDGNHNKQGGSLVYIPEYNGNILIFIRYPQISRKDINITPDPPTESLDTLEPKDITELIVVGHVEKFFTKMIEWEKKEDNRRGF